MSERFNYTGEGRFSRWFSFGGFTTRVHIRGNIGVSADASSTQITAIAEFRDENLSLRSQQFGPMLTKLLWFDFWAGQDNSRIPQMHGPKIKINAPRGVPLGITWLIANQRPLRLQRRSESLDLSELDAHWMRTGFKRIL